jgi:hypothetical protein
VTPLQKAAHVQKKHQQPALISAASEPPEKQLKRLENSWAGTFYKEFFSRIDEQ